MVTFSFEAQIILSLAICLISAFLLNLLFRKFKLPQMIAPLFVGLFFNFYLLDNLAFLPEFSNIVEIFANFGVIVVLFFIGLGVDFRYLKDLQKNSSIMALNAAHIPFFFGLFATFFYTRNWVQSIFVGIALTITAEEVTISILDELKLLHKRVGQLIIEAGIIGDVFEILAITLLGLFIRSIRIEATPFTFFKILFELSIFILITLIMRYFVIEWLLQRIGKDGRTYEYFAVAFVVLLVMALASELLNFSHIIGALLAGILLKDMLIQDKLYRAEHHIIEAIEVFDLGVFQPLIFIWIGLSIDFNLLMQNIEFGIVLTILALLGKLLGAVLGNHFCKEPLKEGILIGWGLNARGATELFALLIAKNTGLVTQNVFSAVVFMALMTTIISPIVFKLLVLNGFGLVRHRSKKDYNHRIKTKA